MECGLVALALLALLALDDRIGSQIMSGGGLVENGPGLDEEVMMDFTQVGERSVPVSVDKQLETLRDLGIQVTPEQEESLREDTAELEEMPYTLFLIWIGMGDYNYDTWEWTPTSEQVFAFDLEVFDVGNMYPLFLEGLQTISGLDLADAAQDDSSADWEAGTGILDVTYKLNGTPYSFQARLLYDWLDIGILENVNQALEHEGIEKRFYATSDGGQGVLIFYANHDWAKQFFTATGLRLQQSLE